MEKLSQEKRYTFTIVVQGNGERVIQWDANQGMDGACHQASDILNPGTAKARKVWEDKGKRGPSGGDQEKNPQRRNQTI